MTASSENVNIVAMSSDHLPEVMVVERRNYPIPWSEGNFKSSLKWDNYCQMLRQGDQLLGYGILQLAADEAHILNICIDSAHTGKGYAKRLLRHLFDYAESKGVHTVYLEVRRSNERAQHVYSEAGFNEIGVRKNYYDASDGREDAIVMAKSLAWFGG